MSYDHHKRDLVNKLMDIQHDFQKLVISSQHIHIDHHNCLEILAVRGKAKDVEKLAKYSELALPAPAAKEAAGTIDNDDKDIESAGFVISKSVDDPDVQASLAAVIKALQTRIPKTVVRVLGSTPKWLLARPASR